MLIWKVINVMKLVITSGYHPVLQDTGGGGCGGGGGAATPRDGGHDLKHRHTLQECVTYGRIVICGSDPIFLPQYLRAKLNK